jgi:hypothetical protein
MNEHLRSRIQRRLESLSDDRGYQILDYIEFLESKYADKSAPGPSASAANPFTKFTEAVEDRLRAGRVSATAIAETVNLMNKASSVLNSALNATKTMASELAAVPDQMRAATPASQPSGTKPASAGSSEASSPAHETKQPGSGEEKL